MSTPKLSDVLEAFFSSFKSVDVRFIAVKPKNQWTNVITSIFPSTDSPEQTESLQQQMRGKLPVNSEDFMVQLANVSLSGLNNLFDRISSGEPANIRRGIGVQFRQFDPWELPVFSSPHDISYLKDAEHWKLAGSEARGRDEDRADLWCILDNQNGRARLRGYRDIYESINEALRIERFERGNARDFVVGIPIPARIQTLSLVDSCLEIQIKKVPHLMNLQSNIFHERTIKREPYLKNVSRRTELVNNCEHPGTGEFCCVTNSIALTNLRPSDWIEVQLIHREVPTLNIDGGRLRVPLENPSEPFARTLSEFCSFDLLRERLLDPEKLKKPSKEFENAVTWLLSLIGFSVIQLGKSFENLQIPKTKYQIGSIDLLAYRENETLFLIGCDTSMPDEKEIRSLKAVADHFKFVQDDFRQPNIVPMIFTPKDCTGVSTVDPVKIADAHRISSILEKAMEGKTEDARASLILW